MRVYIPPGAGLGAPEISAMRRLSRPSLQVIVEELQEPGSHDTIRWILQQRDPERALADAITENIQQATLEATAHHYAGLSDAGMGKSFFKKLVKINRRVFNAARRVTSKIAQHDPIYKVLKPTLKKVMNVARKFAPIIITVAGAVLSPFTGGASLAAAAVLTTAYKLRAMKIDADKAKRAGKAEAAVMQGEVNRQNAQVMSQADGVYAQNTEIFLAAGYDQARWNSLTLDQKVDLIERASAGTLQPTPEAVAAQQQVVGTATQAAFAAAEQAAGPSGIVAGGTAYGGNPAPGGDYAPPSPPDTSSSSAPVPVPGAAPDTTGSAATVPPAPAPAPASGGSGLFWMLLAGGAVVVAASGKKGR